LAAAAGLACAMGQNELPLRASRTLAYAEPRTVPRTIAWRRGHVSRDHGPKVSSGRRLRSPSELRRIEEALGFNSVAPTIVGFQAAKPNGRCCRGMQAPEELKLRRRRTVLLYACFAVALFFDLVVWAFSGTCENDCSGPQGAASQLTFGIVGGVFIVIGVIVQSRWRPTFGMVLWMIGVVLLVHGLLA
jgi:hypothetical protein